MSLISDADKASLSAVLHSGVVTWFRPLTVWQEAQTLVIASDPSFNPYTAYNQNSTAQPVTPVQTVISGAILWDKSQDYPFLKPEIQAAIKVRDDTKRACRLKVDPSGYALVAPAKQVQIDGVNLVPDTKPRPHGLFAVDRYTFYFVRSD